MTEAHWKSYGALLARVHATQATGRLAELLQSEDHDLEPVAAAARSLHSRLCGADDPGLLDDSTARSLAGEWPRAEGLLSTLLEQAKRLGRELRGRPAPSVICHGDPHLGNLVIGKDGQVWLIDWDDAALAPRERDLMFVFGGVLAFAPVSEQQRGWFFEGYGPAEVDRTRLAYYQCTRALVDLVDPALQVLEVDKLAQSEREDALVIVRGILSPTGLVNLALSSLRDLNLIPDRPDWPPLPEDREA